MKKLINYSKYIICNRAFWAFAIFMGGIAYIVEGKHTMPLWAVVLLAIALVYYSAFLVCVMPKYQPNKYEQPMVDFFKRLGETDETYQE